MVVSAAGEQKPEPAAHDLHAGGDARIGRLEGEAVGALDVLRVEIPGQDQKIPCVAVGGDTSSDTPSGLHGQHRRQIESSRFEVERWVHGPEGTISTAFFV